MTAEAFHRVASAGALVFIHELPEEQMVTSHCKWRAGVLCAFLAGAFGGLAHAQAGLVQTLDLSATATEADTCDFNRYFNEVYVADFNMPPFGTQLHVYDLSFNFLRDETMQSPPGFSAPEGGIRDPQSGDFFFPSFSADVIRRFASNGTFISEFPTGFRSTGLTYDSNNDTLWCAACCGTSQGIVAQFTLAGMLVSSFNLPAGASPVGLAFDPVSDTLFITANSDDHVDEYTKTGVFVQQFLPPDPYPGNGVGIGYDPATGNLYYGGQSSLLFVFNDPGRPTLPQASCTFRNGSGLNPPDLTCATSPVLGQTWSANVSTTPTLGVGTLGTLLGVAAGGPVSGVFVFGFELLALPPLLILDPGLGPHSIPIPYDPTLAGVSLSTQGARIEVDSAGGTRVVLTNAQDLVFGA